MSKNCPIPDVWFWVGCRKVIMDGVRMARKLPSLGRFSRMMMGIKRVCREKNHWGRYYVCLGIFGKCLKKC